MGIRIHKVLCWALLDVKVKKYNICDPRFNTEALESLCGEEGYYNRKKNLDKFLEWVRSLSNQDIKLIIKEVNRTDKTYPDNFLQSKILGIGCKQPGVYADNFGIIHEKEFGFPNVFGFQPIEFPEFFRYDDAIDYYSTDNGQPEYKELSYRGGVYPFDHYPIVRLPNDKNESGTIDLSKYDIAHIFVKTNKPDAGKGLEYYKDIVNGHRCHIPTSILLLSKYFNLFNNWALTVNQLRPILYTYWS